MEIDRRPRLEAVKNLRQTENIRNALQWIRQNPEGFATRVREFENIIDTMNNLILKDAIDDKRYSNITAMKGFFIEEDSIITPSELVGLYDDWKEYGEYEEAGKFIVSFSPKLHNTIAAYEWEFPTKITDNPNKVASGLLIEGYGKLIEDFYEKKGLARKFVLGFEEILISQNPDSELLSDAIDWMAEKEEKDKIARIIA